MKYKAAIFDMDGTILDTITDITNSLNMTLLKYHHMHNFTDDQVNYLFGSGIKVALYRVLLIERGITIEDVIQYRDIAKIDQQHIDEMAVHWKAIYQEKSLENTKPFDGIVEMIQQCKEKGMYVGIVSNKPDPAVQALTKIHFGTLFDAVLGEREDIQKKPAPDMLLHVIKKYELNPSEVIYVGDTEIDILTANNANCDVIAVTWGFRSLQFLQSCNPTYIVSNIEDLKDIIIKNN